MRQREKLGREGWREIVDAEEPSVFEDAKRRASARAGQSRDHHHPWAAAHLDCPELGSSMSPIKVSMNCFAPW